MESIKEIPFVGELPSAFADRLGLLYTALVSGEHKKAIGQYFTPHSIAKYMASFASPNKERINIMDPGSGIGILSCALVEYLVEKKHFVKEIVLTAFESDNEILPYTDKCLEYLSAWLKDRNIIMTYFLCKNDFILHNARVLENKHEINELYDLIITNPPYFKIKKGDERAIAAKAVIYGQSNIYSIFLLIACKLLQENGQLIFITPRSFASGSYFRVFREIFFSLMRLENIHIFDSRRKAFKRDKILQENIIVNSIRKADIDKKQLLFSFVEDNSVVNISVSNEINDLKPDSSKNYLFKDLVNINSYQRVLHIPTSDMDDAAINIFKSWTGSLQSYGIQISTGPVVDFRSNDFINTKALKNSVPLIWLHNINKMSFVWPNISAQKGKVKGEYIMLCPKSNSRLINNKNYVFLRRFSTKEDKSRLVAAPYLSVWLPNYKKLGVENHLNYIYRLQGNLTQEEAFGIAALLNSKLFDVYFRTFNGNINVSATELRDMPFPNIEIIKGIGEELSTKKNMDETTINQIVEKHFSCA